MEATVKGLKEAKRAAQTEINEVIDRHLRSIYEQYRVQVELEVDRELDFDTFLSGQTYRTVTVKLVLTI